MLTGDKGETALEIGYSCGLFEREGCEIFIIEESEDNLEQKLFDICSKAEKTAVYGCMIAGNYLPEIFASKDLSKMFHSLIH
jgi:magnesium-transporting ATPase (P-type)